MTHRIVHILLVVCGMWIAPVHASEPFGRPTTPVVSGGLYEKWIGVQRNISEELKQMAVCEHDQNCSLEAIKFLSIIRAGKARVGRARLGEVNRALNLSIRAVNETVDVWSSPLLTLARGGDCEDYAIAKFVALREAGISSDDLRIVVLHDTLSNGDHAVAVVRMDGHWMVLDNRRMTMIEDVNIRNYHPLFVID